MLLGQYEGKIGEKWRIGLPSKFREALGNKLIVTKGLETNLLILSEQGWETLLEGTVGKPFTDKSTREMQRFLLGNATGIELDSKGRFVIPEYLRVYANIDVDVIFAGINKFVELWDKKLWEDQQLHLSKNIESIAEKLSRSEEKVF